MRTKKVLFISLLLIFILLTSGCLGGFFNKNKAPEIISVAVINAKVGVEYTYEVIATDADDDPLTYTLVEGECPEDMEIDETNVISWIPTEDGNYQVIVEVNDGKKSSFQKFTIIVAEALLESIVVVPSEMTVYVGNSEDISSITAHYDNETTSSIELNSDDVSYSSDDEAVAAVSTTGVVTGVSAGEAIITVSYTENYTEEDDITKTDTITVTVPPALSYIKVEPEFMNIFVGSSQPITSIKAYYEGSTTPADIALNDANASYAVDSIDTPDIITVNALGVVTGVTASDDDWKTITVSYTEGTITKTDIIYVKVEPAPVILIAISVTPPTMVIPVDNSQPIIQIRANYSDTSFVDIDGAGLISEDISYEPSDGPIAKVNNSGVVTGVSVGTATITVSYTEEGITMIDTVIVTVTAL